MASVRISDHAVIRFLERHYGFDFEAERAKLDSPVVQKAGMFGNCTVKTSFGRLVIQDKTVVTFLPPRGKVR